MNTMALNSKQDSRQFYPLLAPYLCSDEVYKELGYPLLTNDNMTWLVVVGENNKVMGFIAYSITNTGVANIENQYILPAHRGKGVCKKLINMCIKSIKGRTSARVAKAVPLIRDAKAFEEAGFEVVKEWVKFKKVELNLSENA